MSLNRREIEQMARALSALEGSFVQKIQLCAPRRLFIDLRQPGKGSRLFVCCESGATRLHLAEEREASPAQPPAFQGMLRARLIGSRLARIEQLPGERAVALSFQSRQAEAADHCLVAELTGRHGNLFLLDSAGRILGSALPSTSARRALRAGALYQAPLPQPEGPPEAEASRFEGASDPVILSRAIAALYREREAQARIAAARASRLKPLRAELRKVQRALDRARADLARCGAADAALRRGNLLKENLHRLAAGQRSVRLVEYTPEGAREVALELNPALTPQQEVEAAFRSYRRWTNGRDKALARVELLAARERALAAQIAATAALPDAQLDLDSQTAPAAGRAVGGRADRRTKAGQTPPFREYRSAAGQRIWVGRSARHNDALTFGCARGNDAWLHARGRPGAHVIVPLARGEALHDETRRDACELARHFSSARGEAAEVSWTQVKFVRRQKGGTPGAVTYSQEKTALIRPDAARLERLLSTAGG